MFSFQYWLGGFQENLENFLLMLIDKYVYFDLGLDKLVNYQELVVYFDMGIWYFLFMQMFENVKDYLEWYN